MDIGLQAEIDKRGSHEENMGMQAGSGDAVEYYFNCKDVHNLFMLYLFADVKMCYFACLRHLSSLI